ncbi:hypothetical protein R70723_08365 [Paenibacillus sp. FSL R7-0273]|nr:hypothetical protein R70723_08365 [Paenibacillus sp. FSL R7-0273]OMF84292.1 hypothetical protein BK144_30315 [Paenibacillus sp. FSL R7-0273]
MRGFLCWSQHLYKVQMHSVYNCCSTKKRRTRFKGHASSLINYLEQSVPATTAAGISATPRIPAAMASAVPAAVAAVAAVMTAAPAASAMVMVMMIVVKVKMFVVVILMGVTVMELIVVVLMLVGTVRIIVLAVKITCHQIGVRSCIKIIAG